MLPLLEMAREQCINDRLATRGGGAVMARYQQRFGNVIAGDDKVQVATWLKAGDLLQPGPSHAEHWQSSQAKFTALVVSPFVLIQPLATQSP